MNAVTVVGVTVSAAISGIGQDKPREFVFFCFDPFSKYTKI